MPRPLGSAQDLAATPNIAIVVPGMLRPYCRGATRLTAGAASVGELLAELKHSQLPLYVNLCDETGTVRRHIGVFVNESHIRDLEGLDTKLVPGDVVTFLPAVSGG